MLAIIILLLVVSVSAAFLLSHWDDLDDIYLEDLRDGEDEPWPPGAENATDDGPA